MPPRTPHCGYLNLAGIVLALVTAGAIATFTPLNAHPDELIHVDAFKYFEHHFWPPDVNADGIYYSPYGWSRVYTGELVYVLYGTLGRALKTVLPPLPSYQLYRLLQFALLAFTLAYLATRRTPHWDTKLGLAFTLGFPQFVYLFSYANSDAFGLAVSFVLFFETLRATDQPLADWTWQRTLALGCLFGLPFVCKSNFLAALILPAAFLVQNITRSIRAAPRARLLALAGLFLAGVLAVAAPLKIVYPLTQGDMTAKVARMREERAKPNFKPSNPQYFGLNLAQKGKTYRDLIVDMQFFQTLSASFWGAYGFMNIFNPPRVYYLAYGLLGLACLLTAARYLRGFSALDPPLRLGLPLGITVILGLTAGVLYLSLHVDYQAQGRYLYGAFVPVLLTLSGTFRPGDGGPARTAAFGLARLLWLMSLYSLWFVLMYQHYLKVAA